ncbi:alpha/beta hydrolase [Actinosynnema sp. NPDC047251]|uniref:Uncharacterized protein n=1 Tax=Saccharothrix espanaensis (strain ATCC 51144 / DSM 44229 / JCM 9112 / NBRC 15066 / NRRL 15764) TaxID=1179773 RepID=K0K0B7_SACES|nr:alpha/beta hydrolase [Saccharothrix espanaensis]CCH30982.1 hypothetical protein BN6_36880 [Saccharothrix espanaensis DSM 44229]
MRITIGKAAALLVVAVLLGTAVQGVAAAVPRVEWHDCGDGLQCGSVRVPVDWGDRASARIDLGLARLPARDQSRKKGTLLHNPGGPAPAIEYLPLMEGALDELTEWFDVVVFDPRGFGASGGVSCPEPVPFTLDWGAPDRAAYDGFATANRAFADRCAAAMGPLRGKLNSWQVAHDMEAVRVALGQRRLNYYGNSYGTVFGQVYAELFGHNVGRMYLDSLLDHTSPDRYPWTVAKAEVSERNLHRFARWCDREPACALHGRDPLATWDRVVAAAERAPIPAPGASVPATAGLILGQARVGDERDWPGFALAVAEADAGDASRFVPRLPPPPGAIGPDLAGVMMCADFPYETDYRAVRRLSDRLRDTIAPRLGRTDAWYPAATHCAGLPRVGTYPPRPLRPRGLPPVLIASGSADHVTPPGHGRNVARQLPGARYLPVEGGHALYWSGNPCVRGHVHRYLLDGTMPATDATCPAT